MQDLPHKLKIEVSLYIYEDRYNKIKFFKGRTPSFISWLCPLLKPLMLGENQYIFLEGDEVNMIYFMVRGDASYVLPSFENVRYINVKVGDHFGVMDIPSSAEKQEFPLDDWFEKKNQL